MSVCVVELERHHLRQHDLSQQYSRLVASGSGVPDFRFTFFLSLGHIPA